MINLKILNDLNSLWTNLTKYVYNKLLKTHYLIYFSAALNAYVVFCFN